MVPGAVRGFPGVGAAPSSDVWLLGPASTGQDQHVRVHNGYAVNQHDEVLDLHHRYRDPTSRTLLGSSSLSSEPAH